MDEVGIPEERKKLEQIIFRVTPGVKLKFKLKCTVEGKDMNSILSEFVNKYVSE